MSEKTSKGFLITSSTDNVSTFYSNENKNWESLNSQLGTIDDELAAKADLSKMSLEYAKGEAYYSDIFPLVATTGTSKTASTLWGHSNYIIKEGYITATSTIAQMYYILYANGRVELYTRMIVKPEIQNEKDSANYYSGLYALTLPFDVIKSKMHCVTIDMYNEKSWREVEAHIVGTPSKSTSESNVCNKVTFVFQSDKKYSGTDSVIVTMTINAQVSDSVKQLIMTGSFTSPNASKSS